MGEMTEEETSFDPSLKKKKKKKKTPFDLDGALNDAEGDNETPEPAKDENLDDLDLENFGKKKKKVGEGDEEKGDKEKDESEDIDLESFGKKKKPKKKKNINLDELKEALDDDNKENADQGSEIVTDQ